MTNYTQANRPLAITTPLGKDTLLLTGIQGDEAISELFLFQVELLAKRETKISFDAILGQSVTVELELLNGGKRYISGIVSRFGQGERDQTFTHYRAEIVPKLWLLTRKVRSRIFQHLAVPDILKKVLVGFGVQYRIVGSYEPRDYCVQYRESDFAFASRLMEEEGIYYFFRHDNGSHQMMVSDVPQHLDLPAQSTVEYEETFGGGKREDMRIIAWEKLQELRSGKCTLWDHCFELPGKNLEAQKLILDSVQVGKVTHKLKVAGNDQLEIYEYPGGYAQRFDGVDKGGGDRPADLQKIFKDNERTVKIRMEQEELPGLQIQGSSYCRHFLPGHKFTLSKHFDADGEYLLTRVEHRAQLDGDYRSGGELPFTYENRFTCIPNALPFRPARVTQRPTISGIQTANVVGPPGEEIFVDKYGRVKVQFHWDREGKKNLDSSCWLRVAQPWAGKGWGAFFWPRVGNEVVVVFEEGDPDQPLIVGSVYNAENLPPFVLPLKKQLGGIRSSSVRGIAHENYNAIVFIDEKGHEHLGIHSERTMTFNAELDKMFHAGRHKGERVAGTNVFTVGHLPGGGGSGGGAAGAATGAPREEAKKSATGDWVGGPAPSEQPEPVGMAGINAIMVYGENLQVAVGLNHQLALGSNLQLCINPFGLAAGVSAPVSPALSGLLGSGLGGNMQLTIGTSAQFVMGQAFDINLGPEKFEVKGGNFVHQASNILCGVIAALATAWVITYGIDKTDADRALSVDIFQIAISAVLAVLMLVEEEYDKRVKITDSAWPKMFRAAGWEITVEKGASELVRGILDSAVVIGAVATPPIVASLAKS